MAMGSHRNQKIFIQKLVNIIFRPSKHIFSIKYNKKKGPPNSNIKFKNVYKYLLKCSQNLNLNNLTTIK